eukprot:11829852-Alexandrium_andersonii.AAC.1
MAGVLESFGPRLPGGDDSGGPGCCVPAVRVPGCRVAPAVYAAPGARRALAQRRACPPAPSRR